MGKNNTRAVIYGYKMENGIIMVNEDEANIVRRIYSERLSGIGVYAIGKRLYEEQIPFFEDSRDKSMKKASAILYKSVYCGDKGYSPIVKKTDFERVSELKAKPFRKKNYEISKITLIDYSTKKIIYEPNERISELEKKLEEELKKQICDDTVIKEMIFGLAAEKYSCVRLE